MAAPDDYVTFGRSGLRVSSSGLGGGGFGTGDTAVEAEVLRRYLDLGGNFVDTAEIYGFHGKSEAWLGQQLEKLGVRDRVVIGTKLGPTLDRTDPNSGGCGRKNILRALAGSLERLRTSFVDIYWLHVWDRITPIDEVVETMDALVAEGRIRHYGFSNVPAWYAARAYTLAEQSGRSRPVGLELEHSLVERAIEHEHLDAAREMGLGVCVYSPLADGFLTGKYARAGAGFEGSGRLEERRKSGFVFQRTLTDRHWDILDSLKAVAADLGRSPADVALAWVSGRPGVTVTILGARRAEQLDDNLRGAAFELPPEARAQLDAASAGPLSNPYSMFTPAFQDLLQQGMRLRPWRP